MHLAQEVLMNIQCSVIQEVLQRRREPGRWGAWWPATGSWQWPIRAIIEADPLTTMREVIKELNADHFVVIQHLTQIGKMKKLHKWVPHVLTKNKKKSFWSVIFSCSMQQQRTVSRLDCDVWRKVDCVRQPAVTSSVMKPRRSSKARPKAKLAPKKGHGHCLVGLLPVWSTTAFWIPEKPAHPRSTLGKMMMMRGAEGCRARGRHGPPGRAGSSPQQTNTSQVEGIGLRHFASNPHIHLTSHQLITTSSSISTTFCRENDSSINRRQKMLSWSLSNLKAWVVILHE